MTLVKREEMSPEQPEHIRLGVESWARGYYLVRPASQQTEEQRREQLMQEMRELEAYVAWARAYWLGRRVWVYLAPPGAWMLGVVRLVHWSGVVAVHLEEANLPVTVQVRYLGNRSFWWRSKGWPGWS